jgi:hypothetical protein
MMGIAPIAQQTLSLASLTAPGSTVMDRAATAGIQLHQAASAVPNVYQQADAAIQLVMGILLIVLGFFLHALARMQNGERPVHITVKPKKKRQMWFWVDMRI